TQYAILPVRLAAALEELSRAEGATLFMTLLAVLQTLLYRYTGQEDICGGSPIAGRDRVEIERLIGFFVNTLVLRTRLDGAPSFREVLGRVRETALDAYDHQSLPFERLVEVLQPERDLSRQPLFQVWFALQNAPMGELKVPGLTVRPLDTGGETAKFDLSLAVTEEPDGLHCAWEYSTDLFDAETVG